MRLGVVLEAFLDRTLDDTLDLVARGAPQITDLEIGVGGFAPTPHCDVQQLLRDPTARRRWTERLEDRGFHLSALNVSGNPLDPDGTASQRVPAVSRMPSTHRRPFTSWSTCDDRGPRG